jgi:hypothetical protein
MIERSINGYPNNYMRFRTSSDIADLIDSSSVQIGLLNDIIWLAGSGTYQLDGSDNVYCLNIYDLSQNNCISVPGIPYDSPEGGNAQWANASYYEIQPSQFDQQQTQLPNSTAPSNLNNSTDPNGGWPAGTQWAMGAQPSGYNVIVKPPRNPKNIQITKINGPLNPDIFIRWQSDTSQPTGSTNIFNYEIEFRNITDINWKSWNQNAAVAAGNASPYYILAPATLDRATAGFLGGQTYEFRITAQSFSGNSETIVSPSTITY